MRVVRARNVNDAWVAGLDLVYSQGVARPSRNGDVLVVPEPVTTVYEKPTERVLFDATRDANPIFHLHESLWMLAGRNDATWLDQFVSNFSARFAEDGGVMHGAYGKRWIDWFVEPNPGYNNMRDRTFNQLDKAVDLLSKDPYDRQVVIQMWDPQSDFGVPGLKDRPCNQQILLRADRELIDPAIVDISSVRDNAALRGLGTRQLDMTVTCRSNDAVFGCYGANAVHFSFLQEYLAARLGMEVGRYYQVSNNLHLYESSRSQANPQSAAVGLYISQNAAGPESGYPATRPLVDDPDAFDDEVREYVERPELHKLYRNSFLNEVAQKMYWVNVARQEHRYGSAADIAEAIGAQDWALATAGWVSRRQMAYLNKGKKS